MTAEFRRIRGGTTPPEPLTEAEEYSLWSSHIRMLFSTPDMHYSIYDRTLGSGPPLRPRNHEERLQMSSPLVPAEEGEDGGFPSCFYARMMRCVLAQREVSPLPRLPSRSASWNAPESDTLERYASVSQHLYTTEEDAAERLAAKLRHRQREGREWKGSGESTDWYPTDSFLGDAKVELQQAKLMEEMTELLLHVRGRNALSAQLQQQLLQTKLLQSQLRDVNGDV